MDFLEGEQYSDCSLSGLDISLCTLLTTSVGSGPGVGISRSSGTSEWYLVLGPLVPDTLSDQCNFPGDGHLSGTGSGYIKEFMYFSGAGHRDEWISLSHQSI